MFLAIALASSLALSAAAQGYGKSGGDSVKSEPSDSGREKPERRWGRRDEKTDKGWARKHEVDERTAARLSEALELLQAEQYDEAAATLGKLRLRSLNSLERAKYHRISAFVAYGRDDIASARDHLEKVLEQNALPPEDQAGVRYQIAQLYLSDENWSEVVANLKLWFEMVDNPNSSAYYLLAIAHYQLEDLDAALSPAQTAVDIADVPKEGWIQLLLALRLTRKEYAEAAPLLEQLIELYPKKTYWIQLSTVHGALGNYDEALVPLQLAYTQGLLNKEAELRRLAELLLFLDLPYRAARVVERGVDEKLIAPAADNYELLSNSWIAAREYEKAVEPLGRAAKLAANGDLYVRLAQVHIQREKWSEAADVLRLALDKGGLANAGDAQLLMGIAYYSQKRPQQALAWFARASEHEATQEEAENWLKHINRELGSS
jgi:tetratricopeptide (TPR) repeat protein